MDNNYYVQVLLEEYEEFFLTEENDISFSKNARKDLLKKIEKIFNKYNFVDKDIYAKGGKCPIEHEKHLQDKSTKCEYYTFNIEGYKIRLVIEEKQANMYFHLNKEQIYITLLVSDEDESNPFLQLVYSSTK